MNDEQQRAIAQLSMSMHLMDNLEKFADYQTGVDSPRQCGGCTFCCKAAYIATFDSPNGVKCPHQRYRGCAIYADRPYECSHWSCMWRLNHPVTQQMKRPDRAGYMIDSMLHPMQIGREDDVRTIPNALVYCDPLHRDAWRDDHVKGFILGCASAMIPTMIRFNAHEGIVVFAPPLVEEWREETVTQWTVGKE